MEPVAATIDGGAAGALIVTSLAIMGSPGPATLSLTALGSAYGVRRSLSYLAGIIAGTTLVLLAVATGVTATLLALPALRMGLVAISAAYILWLAYHVATAPPLSENTAASPAPTLPGGLLLGVANPKAWIAIAAVFASATVSRSAPTDTAAKIALLTAAIVVHQRRLAHSRRRARPCPSRRAPHPHHQHRARCRAGRSDGSGNRRLIATRTTSARPSHT
jgi:threonine/homoserine/homoserine lactone efflux protein